MRKNIQALQDTIDRRLPTFGWSVSQNHIGEYRKIVDANHNTVFHSTRNFAEVVTFIDGAIAAADHFAAATEMLASYRGQS